MSSERFKNGFIHDGSMGFVNIKHYRRVLTSKSLWDEEYWYQSVFHGPDQAKALRLEVFDKKISNKLTNLVETDEMVTDENVEVVNKRQSREIQRMGNQNWTGNSTILQSDLTSEKYKLSLNPAKRVGIAYFIESIAEICDPTELRVLAYFLVVSKLDSLLYDLDSEISEMENLSKLLEEVEILHKEAVCVNFMYAHCGTRTRYNKAAKSLRDKIREYFPNLVQELGL